MPLSPEQKAAQLKLVDELIEKEPNNKYSDA
jgi:hypothetical protein